MKKPRSNSRTPVQARPALGKIELLREAFQSAVDILKRRRADLLQPATIDAYVELDWLSWQGGSLKLTTVGENICKQLRNERAELAAA